ncbi:MAG: peroxiredoxin-like family protein [Rhodospirillales bacterium]
MLDDLLRDGPVVLLFFRFAGCPACNIALPYYQRQLYPELRELGATLIALSPQLPGRLVEIRDKHGLEFIVASDKDNELARSLGILYSADEASRDLLRAKRHLDRRNYRRRHLGTAIPGGDRCRSPGDCFNSPT